MHSVGTLSTDYGCGMTTRECQVSESIKKNGMFQEFHLDLLVLPLALAIAPEAMYSTLSPYSCT